VNRRAFVAGLGAVLAAPLAAEAQRLDGSTQRPGGKHPRVGYLATGLLRPYLIEAFREGLRESGYVEGQSVTIEFKVAERYERLPDLAAELVRLGVDVIFAPNELSADSAKQATQTIPIVFTGASDPVASQFVVSLARPGGNMTGLTLTGTQVTGKRLSLLKEALVKLSRVAVLSNPRVPTHHLAASRDAARGLALKLLVFEARIPRDLEGAFLAMVKDRAQALLLLPDIVFYQMQEQLGQLALRHQLPMIGWRPDFARSGALLAYGAELSTDHRRGGALVGKILSGAKPSDIPVEEPSKLELVINLKTAKTLGLTIPPSLLLRADHVIE
jgi:putative ABC transport system substrate-binding protein